MSFLLGSVVGGRAVSKRVFIDLKSRWIINLVWGWVWSRWLSLAVVAKVKISLCSALLWLSGIWCCQKMPLYPLPLSRTYPLSLITVSHCHFLFHLMFPFSILVLPLSSPKLSTCLFLRLSLCNTHLFRKASLFVRFIHLFLVLSPSLIFFISVCLSAASEFVNTNEATQKWSTYSTFATDWRGRETDEALCLCVRVCVWFNGPVLGEQLREVCKSSLRQNQT